MARTGLGVREPTIPGAATSASAALSTAHATNLSRTADRIARIADPDNPLGLVGRLVDDQQRPVRDGSTIVLPAFRPVQARTERWLPSPSWPGGEAHTSWPSWSVKPRSAGVALSSGGAALLGCAEAWSIVSRLRLPRPGLFGIGDPHPEVAARPDPSGGPSRRRRRRAAGGPRRHAAGSRRGVSPPASWRPRGGPAAAASRRWRDRRPGVPGPVGDPATGRDPRPGASRRGRSIRSAGRWPARSGTRLAWPGPG